LRRLFVNPPQIIIDDAEMNEAEESAVRELVLGREYIRFGGVKLPASLCREQKKYSFGKCKKL
jgi:hypothetical protein